MLDNCIGSFLACGRCDAHDDQQRKESESFPEIRIRGAVIELMS